MKKVIPINGISIDKIISFHMKVFGDEYDDIIFIKFQDFLNWYNNDDYYFINMCDIKECETVAVYTSQNHNTLEVINIKIIISILFFSQRLSLTDGIGKEEVYKYLKYDEFFHVYHLSGFFSKEGNIINDKWYVKLGNSKLSRDDFDPYITRAFSSELCDEYDRQSKFRPYCTDININEDLKEKVEMLLNKINNLDEYSGKLKSVFRIYYDILNENNLENVIMAYATILEVLLLDKDESNQRKKVSVRSACILEDEKEIDKKIFIADIVFYFYNYRNYIVHDGKAFVELKDNEVTVRNIMCYIRHIIYFIIKRLLESDIKNVDEIKDIVSKNVTLDGINNAFEYIKYENTRKLNIIWND